MLFSFMYIRVKENVASFANNHKLYGYMYGCFWCCLHSVCGVKARQAFCGAGPKSFVMIFGFRTSPLIKYASIKIGLTVFQLLSVNTLADFGWMHQFDLFSQPKFACKSELTASKEEQKKKFVPISHFEIRLKAVEHSGRSLRRSKPSTC